MNQEVIKNVELILNKLLETEHLTIEVLSNQIKIFAYGKHIADFSVSYGSYYNLKSYTPTENCIGDSDIADRDVYADLLLLISKMLRTNNYTNIMKILETLISK
ncbi:hypothetical protein [Brachyspira alvinipulli]|uniref:hypothetical protein n=1 Tax=Brachyspira alvinipulli TaxID=84379 RepID=UPI00048227FE|nr:hypothetical protein [Brachyspira alvinipulli]